MRFDFASVVNQESFITVPVGWHRCRVAEVRDGRARDGSVRWSLRLEALDGEHAGKTAAWDALTWSECGIFRVKRVLEALGLDVSGILELEPQDLVGLRALVQTEEEEREDPTTGAKQIRARVPYDGYRQLEAPAQREAQAQHRADLELATSLRAQADALEAKWRGKP